MAESLYRTQIDPMFPNDSVAIQLQLVGKSKKVLELGAADGYVTEALTLAGNTVTAVEIDGRFKDKLAQFADQVIITDLDALDLIEKCDHNKFDVILAGDVLEHCRFPELVINQFHGLLSSSGYVVASIPNVAHADVRLALLDGRFDYTESGLLDKTHLRFFTWTTIKDFFYINNFGIEEVFSTSLPLGATEIGPPSGSIPQEAIKFIESDRQSIIYQYIVKATSTKSSPAKPNVGKKLSASFTIEQLLAERASLTELLEDTRQKALTTYFLEDQINLARQDTDQINLARQDTDQIKHLQIKFLESQDEVIGLNAVIGELNHRLEKRDQRITFLQNHIDRLNNSLTWRIGRFFTFPIRVIRRILAQS